MPSEDNQLLLQQPMNFFKRYAVSPPDDAGYSVVPVPGRLATLKPTQTLSDALEIWSDPDHTVLPQDASTITYQRVKAGKVVWADVQDVERDKPGAKTFKIHGTKQEGTVPIYYLPWSSAKLMEIRLEDVGADMDNIDEYPRLFFTAALSGCTVFVDGHPARPRVVHAGINGNLQDDAVTFWRRMLSGVSSKTGIPIDDHMMEANKRQYMNTVWGQSYKRFLEADHRDILTIKDVKEWASVFGIRFGRLWSFYLQRNATVTTLRVVKKRDTYRREDERFLTGTAFKVKAQKVPWKLGIKKTIYVAKEQFARPIIIEEFYPTGKAKINPDRRLLVT